MTPPPTLGFFSVSFFFVLSVYEETVHDVNPMSAATGYVVQFMQDLH